MTLLSASLIEATSPSSKHNRLVAAACKEIHQPLLAIFPLELVKKDVDIVGVVDDRQPRPGAFISQPRLDEPLDICIVVCYSWYAQKCPYLAVRLLEAFAADCWHLEDGAGRLLLPHAVGRLQSEGLKVITLSIKPAPA